MNPGKSQNDEGELRKPKKKKMRPGTVLRDPYPIVLWGKIGIPPCEKLWPIYCGVFDGNSVIIEDPGDMNEIYNMGYFGKRMLHRRGYEQSIGDIPLVRERQWKKRVEWAAECGYILVPHEQGSQDGHPSRSGSSSEENSRVALGRAEADERIEATESEVTNTETQRVRKGEVDEESDANSLKSVHDDEAVELCDTHSRDASEEIYERMVTVGESNGRLRQGDGLSSSGETASRIEDADLKDRKEVLRELDKSSQDVSRCKEQAAQGDDSRGVKEQLSSDDGGKRECVMEKGNDECVTSVTVGHSLGSMSVEVAESTTVDKIQDRGENVTKEATHVGPDEKKNGDRRIDVKGKDDEGCDPRKVQGDIMSEEGNVGEVTMEAAEDVSSEKGGKEKSVNENGITSEISEAKEKGGQSEVSGGFDSIKEGEGKEVDMEVKDKVVENALNDPKDASESPSGGDSRKEEDDDGMEVRHVETEVKQMRKNCGEQEAEKMKHSSDNVLAIQESVQCESIPSNSADNGSVPMEPKSNKIVECHGNNSPKSCHENSPKSDLTKTVHLDSDGSKEETVTSTCSGSKTVVEMEKSTSMVDEVSVVGDGEELAKEKTVSGIGADSSTLSENERTSVGIDNDDVEEVTPISPPKRNEIMKLRDAPRKRRHSSNASSLDASGRLESTTENSLEEKEGRKAAKIIKVDEGALVGSGDCEMVEAITDGVPNSERESKSQKDLGRGDETHEGRVEKVSAIKESESNEECPNEYLNKSSDCEIVEIEEESRKGKQKEVENVVVGDGSSKEPPKEGLNPCDLKRTEDSDDDIMEVSVDEDEVHEVTSNARRRYSVDDTGRGASNLESNRDSMKDDIWKIIGEIRKKGDVEIMTVNSKDNKESGENSEQSGLGKKETMDDTEDDDIIEINLQKSDMIELEECDVDDDIDADDELQCTGFGKAAHTQRRMPSGSGGFRKMESWFQNAGAGSSKGPSDRSQKEGKNGENLETVSIDSDCEIAPCILIPDTDSECEEIPGSPTLESDPSIFLPSIDVLQLILEEAFFLVYGLGCLQVWDVRGVDRITSAMDENIRNSGRGEESVCDDDGLQTDVPSSEKGNRKVETTANIPSQSDKIKNSQRNSGSLDCLRESKLTNGSSSGLVSDPLSERIDELTRLRESCDVENVTEHPLSLQNSKKSSQMDIPDNVSKSKMKEGVHDAKISKFMLKDNASLDKDTFVSNECRPSDKVPLGSQPVKENPSVSDSVSCMRDADSFDEVPGTQQSCNRGKNDNETQRGECKVRENGIGGEGPSITVIDLADSPPHSRQWSKRGGWSSDEDAMDNDSHDVSILECGDSVSGDQTEQPAAQMLNGGFLNPMTIVELWNAFRSSRSSISPTAIPFETSYAVYHHFRAKRWVVKPGIRFGGDFLLYKDGPPFYHATYLVLIDDDGKSKFDWHMLGGRNRLAENVGKDLMLCRVEWPSTMTEEQRKSPECLAGLVIQEIVIRRWNACKGRDEEDEIVLDDKDTFIPFE